MIVNLERPTPGVHYPLGQPLNSRPIKKIIFSFHENIFKFKIYKDHWCYTSVVLASVKVAGNQSETKKASANVIAHARTATRIK